jgi:hypothetical protein
VTGIIYFTWVVTGISLSAGLMVLIIGLPIAGVFLLSFRGLALVEGRLVEALLDIRMPRRAVFSDKSMSLWNRFKTWVKDPYTWLSILYLILMLPLGVIYFSVFLTLLVVSLALIASPILQLGFGLPLFTSFDVQYFLPGWLLLMSVIGGSLLFFVMLHLAKLVGKLHGTMAKYMLVRES